MASVNLREEAALMLTRSSVVAELEIHDARIIVDAMRPMAVRAGTVIMREGQDDDVDYMALVLEGQVRAESSGMGDGNEVVISVIDAGQLFGEMGLIDGSPRSATCTALTDLKLAMLTRKALRGLVEVQPGVAARLMLSISRGLADRLRESNRRLRTLSQISRAMQAELGTTHALNKRLLAEKARTKG
ncbi:cyclic nucleotide-binding domain-containing protein [Pseudacidovorax intermedius]|uniref:Cyclic nucleotide-binding domain-containing protein n=1 Tax=Pseudacidovorax intermedius TaxID=433924 RepID=A0A147GPV9_9BURK|nr:cyclic nucleotide-binding domain-containing protein [Pseudacidovorax intermedius]KTT17025.1 hypothetical protein NS331_17800 [Pseudacidovorax intermedius]